MSAVSATTVDLPAVGVLPTSATFEAIGTTCQVLVTEPGALVEAAAIARDHLAVVDRAVSRFRPDSEVCRLAEQAAHGPAWAFASPVFTSYLLAALRAARLSEGLVDPTVGAALVATGYDADLDAVRARAGSAGLGPAAVPGWRRVAMDPTTRRVTVPPGTLLDLGASAKAHAADTIARLLTDRLAGGFLVNLGGDIAVAGPAPHGGWRVGVEGLDGGIDQVVVTTGDAVATSSTIRRTWAAGVGVRHHIIDPRTGDTADTPWALVTCVGATALEANTASTSAVVLAESAPAWLAGHGIPARLVDLAGEVTTTEGWPEATA